MADVTSIEVEGVALDVDREALDDWELAEDIAIASDEASGEDEKLAATVRVFRRVYGADYARVKRELRAANDGRLTAETMTGFLSATFEALGAKN